MTSHAVSLQELARIIRNTSSALISIAESSSTEVVPRASAISEVSRTLRRETKQLSESVSDPDVKILLSQISELLDREIATHGSSAPNAEHGAPLCAVVALSVQSLRKLKRLLNEALVDLSLPSPRRYLFDCGANVGQGVTAISAKLGCTRSWNVQCFEPNPFVIDRLKSALASLPIQTEVIEVAVWHEDCKRDLLLELQEDRREPFEARATGGASNILGTKFQRPEYLAPELMVAGPTVQCIDFTRHLAQLVTEADYVAVKFDCEGAELPILSKLVRTRELSLIDEIFVEWHGAMMGELEEERRLRRVLALSGTITHPWS